MKLSWPWSKPPSPEIRLNIGELELLQNQVVELGRLRDIRDNLQNELWPPAIWKLISLADTFVLGRRGIYPRFNFPEAERVWRQYKVDSRERLNTRQLLRIVLAMLVVSNETFLRIDSGTLTPMPAPMRILYDHNNIPEAYVWGSPRPLRLPANQVWHVMIEWYPGQKRGDSLLWTMWDLLNDRRNFLKSLIKIAKNAARVSLVHKRSAGNPLVDENTTKEDLEKSKTQTFSFDEDSLLQIGPNDSFESVSAGGPTTPPSEIDRLVFGTVGQRAGLSRMAVSGDFSEATYSSARFADLNDQGVWARYQDVLEPIVQYLYEQWPFRAQFEEYFRDIYIPPFPYIDPQRTASVNQLLINMGAKSVQSVIREMGEDPETVYSEIEEHRRKMREIKERVGDQEESSSRFPQTPSIQSGVD